MSHSDVPRVAAYIANQEQHHRKRTYSEEYTIFVKRYGLEWPSAFCGFAVKFSLGWGLFSTVNLHDDKRKSSWYVAVKATSSRQKSRLNATSGKQEAPNSVPATPVIDGNLKRRARKLILNNRIPGPTRGLLRYALEIKDPYLPQLVRRVESGEMIIDYLEKIETPFGKRPAP